MGFEMGGRYNCGAKEGTKREHELYGDAVVGLGALRSYVASGVEIEDKL
jgi:hypothetical protein